MARRIKFRCLALDHDDTVVSSTPTIHYPSFAETLKKIRPGLPFSLEDFLRLSFDPGFTGMCLDVLHFTPEEMALQSREWEAFVKTKTPSAFPGIQRLLTRFREAGGFICVSSHSLSENIYRDYAANGLPTPDLVFGWDVPEENRKPAPYALREIMDRLSLAASDILMVDDLKPGMDMASKCGVAFAAAGWGNELPEIQRYMRENCALYFPSVQELEAFLFED